MMAASRRSTGPSTTLWPLPSCALALHGSRIPRPMARAETAPTAEGLLAPQLHDRLDELGFDVPGEIDPGVLADFGHEGVDQRPAGGLGVDGGEVRLGQHLAHVFGGPAGVDQIVDDEPAGGVRGDALEEVDC